MPQRDLDPKGQESRKLLIEIRTLIEEARRQTAVAVNIGLTLLYWRIGRRIHHEVLGSERAAYGEQIVVKVSRQLNWSHFSALLRLTQPFQREFYAEICRMEGGNQVMAANAGSYCSCLARR
jgi:hypothetical protein